MFSAFIQKLCILSYPVHGMVPGMVTWLEKNKNKIIYIHTLVGKTWTFVHRQAQLCKSSTIGAQKKGKHPKTYGRVLEKVMDTYLEIFHPI